MASRSVKTSCKKTKVRSASGSCVKERPSMKKGGSAGCPPGYHIEDGSGKCIKNTNTFSGTGIGLGILGGLGAGMAGILAGTGEKAIARQKAREIKKATNKKVDATAKKIASNVMKKGGMVKKLTATKRK
jgi:hypothetical protein